MKVEKIKKFKVKYGYGPMEYAVVDEGGELEKAIYAWIEQIPVALGDKMIQGKSILAIEPHYHYYTGWNPQYQPKSGEDFAQIQRDCPKFDGIVEGTKAHVLQLVSQRKVDQIGAGGSTLLLE